MRAIIDFHTHSKFSRACSKNLVPANIALAAARKGIDIVSTSDFTHPQWFEILRSELEERGKGIFKVKSNILSALNSPAKEQAEKTGFILSTELSCIYKHKEKVRRVHHVILAPSFSAVKKLNTVLEKRGCNLNADGRPILGLSSKELLKIILDIDHDFEMIPAHAWTPWFAVFGSKSGYDSIEECFEELTPSIHAIETGLSSDPAMNWKLPFLEDILLVSNSDAHSLDKLGREANAMDLESGDYDEIMGVLRSNAGASGGAGARSEASQKFLFTIEFFPEEGKYHCDGHAQCGVMLYPEESKKKGLLCPKCARPLTLGVLHRINDLAKVAKGNGASNGSETHGSETQGRKNRVPYKSIVPLREIIADAYGVGAASKKVNDTYDKMIAEIGSEFYILLDAPVSAIFEDFGAVLSEAIDKMRQGKIHIEPGYDGIFGQVSIFDEKERMGAAPQKSLF